MSHLTPGSTDTGSRLLSASMFMALGTVLSRLTGFLRAALLLNPSAARIKAVHALLAANRAAPREHVAA